MLKIGTEFVYPVVRIKNLSNFATQKNYTIKICLTLKKEKL